MKKTKITAIIIAAVIIVVAAVAFLTTVLKSSEQKKAVAVNWYRTDSDENGEYEYFLNITGDKAEYIFSSKWVTETVAEFDYEVISKTEIRFFNDTIDKTLTYELINNNTGLVFTPALTSSKASEVWYLYKEEE